MALFLVAGKEGRPAEPDQTTQYERKDRTSDDLDPQRAPAESDVDLSPRRTHRIRTPFSTSCASSAPRPHDPARLLVAHPRYDDVRHAATDWQTSPRRREWPSRRSSNERLAGGVLATDPRNTTS